MTMNLAGDSRSPEMAQRWSPSLHILSFFEKAAPQPKTCHILVFYRKKPSVFFQENQRPENPKARRYERSYEGAKFML